MSTLQRELTIRFHLVQQDAWFTRLVKTVFGSMQCLREAQREKTSLYNAFTAFLHHLRCYGSDGVRIWSSLSDATKKEWCRQAKRMNQKSFNALKDIMAQFEQYGEKIGPLGSSSRGSFLDEEEVAEIVNAPESWLVQAWMKKNLDKWKDAFGATCNGHSFSVTLFICILGTDFNLFGVIYVRALRMRMRLYILSKIERYILTVGH